MQIVKPYARMLSPINYTQDPDTGFMLVDGFMFLRRIEWFGRISHRSEEAQTPDSYKRFIEAVVLGKGDWSITEHCQVSVEAVVDRGITHEWVRHRLGAYTQESTRFVNYAKKMPPSFILPDMPTEAVNHWHHAISNCEQRYQDMLAMGCTPQIARSVFPNGLAAKLIVTYNLRNWRHFLIMRTTKEAHPQMREVTIPLLQEFQAKIPILYDDIIPNEQQSKAISKAR